MSYMKVKIVALSLLLFVEFSSERSNPDAEFVIAPGLFEGGIYKDALGISEV